VVAASFERIHRSNLVGMGVLPLQFVEGTNAQSLGLDGSEVFSVTGLSDAIQPGQMLTLEIVRAAGQTENVPVKLADRYADRGRLLPARRDPSFVLRELLDRKHT
jgi:aconitate hydratase